MTEERMPFGREYEPSGLSKGLKIKNTQSSPGRDVRGFEERADELMADKRKRNKEILKHVEEFMLLMRDHTLVRNKTSMIKEIEHKIMAQLTEAALMVNHDETEIEGMGSVSLINLLFKVVIELRDRANELEFELDKLRKESRSARAAVEHGE